MSISVSEVLAASGLEHAGVIPWGRDVPLDVPGVYVVSSSSDMHDPVGSIRRYEPEASAFAELRRVCPSVTLDGRPADDEELAVRIGRSWAAGLYRIPSRLSACLQDPMVVNRNLGLANA